MTGPRRLAFQLGVTAIVAATAAYVVAIPLSSVRTYGGLPWSVMVGWQAGASFAGLYLLGTAAAVLAGALALVLALRAPGRRDARALAWFAAFLGMFWAAQPAFLVTGWPGRVQLLTFAAVYASYILTTAALLRLAACFPAELRPADLTGDAPGSGQPGDAAHAGDGGPTGVRGLALRRMPPEWLGRRLLDGRAVWGTAAAVALGVPLLIRALPYPSPVADVGLVAAFLAMVVALGVGVAAVRFMRIGYARASDEARRRTLWALAGFVAGVWLVSVVGVISLIGMLGLWTPAMEAALDTVALPIAGLAPVVVMAGLYAAVFGSGALDPALALRRTTAYGALSVLLTFTFAALENAGSALLVDRLGWSPATVGWLAGGAIALLFGGLRRTAVGAVARVEARAGVDSSAARHQLVEPRPAPKPHPTSSREKGGRAQ